MRRSLLIIDRGSREQEAKDELGQICRQVKAKGRYDAVDYCFLEVVPPFIAEGVSKICENRPDALTIVPYFLYPGKKVKAAVSDVMRMQAGCTAKFLVTRPMSMHHIMPDIVRSRVTAALSEAGMSVDEKEADVLIVGHGSVDPNAKMSMQYLIEKLSPSYRNITHCYLEMEKPDISDGVVQCEKNGPKTLVIVFYFLHEGAHVKRDIYEELNPALAKASVGRVVITRHIGTDERMSDLIIERAGEVEGAD